MASWQQRGQAYAAEVLDRIPAEWRIQNVPSIEDQSDVTGPYIQRFLSSEEIEITEANAVDIVAKTSTGVWTAVEVARAFCHRAAIAHQLLNCLHEIFFDQALQDAEQTDRYFGEHKKPIGPLHGLPVSLKDQFHVKGVGTHMGYVGWIDTFQGSKDTGKEKVFESEMVRELRSLGATLYCKTSVPHTLMAGETTNHIIGYTYNPKNRLLSSGGSSGGEGALIGARGSPLGFGTDIGGSIRLPAGFNGLFGLRPSSGRLPYEGMANSADGQTAVTSVVGPLAPTPDALMLAVESLLSTKPWLHDPLVVDMPWRDTEISAVLDPFKRTTQGLSFAVLADDGGCTPHPPVTRAIQTVVNALRKAGHNVIDWNPTPTHPDLCSHAHYAYTWDGGADLQKDLGLSGEPVVPQVILSTSPQATGSEIMAANIARRQALKTYMEYWNSTAAISGTGRPVDAVICPLAPFAAPRPNTFRYYAYSIFVNSLDYTAVTVPVLNVDKGLDGKLEGFVAKDETDKFIQETYDPEVFHGAHVAVQLLGRRFQEEKMLAIAKYVDGVLKQ